MALTGSRCRGFVDDDPWNTMMIFNDERQPPPLSKKKMDKKGRPCATQT
jgi:hypothetical protein